MKLFGKKKKNQKSKKIPNIAIIGIGDMGKVHAKCLLSSRFLNISEDTISNLSAICDIDLAKMATIDNPLIRRFTNYKDIPLDSIDGVIISTPSETHYEIAKYFLEKDKKVLIEKPTTLNINHDIDLYKRFKDKYMVGHLMVYHPVIQEIRNFIVNLHLRIDEIYLSRFNIGKPTLENVWYRFAPHDLSIVSFLLTLLPADVSRIFKSNYASCSDKFYDKWLNRQLFWHDEVKVGFDINCTKVHIDVSRNHPFKEKRMFVWAKNKEGRRVVIQFEEEKNIYKFYWDNETDASNLYGTIVDKPDALSNQLSEFIKFLTIDRYKPLTGSSHAFTVSLLLTLCDYSLLNGLYSDCSMYLRGAYCNL